MKCKITPIPPHYGEPAIIQPIEPATEEASIKALGDMNRTSEQMNNFDPYEAILLLRDAYKSLQYAEYFDRRDTALKIETFLKKNGLATI